jgi:DNA polymerase-3 subunit epsilon
MIITGMDVETTGLTNPDHRLIEVYVGHWDLDSRKLVDEYFQRINPGRSIQAEAERVHGISGAMLAGSPPWESVADRVREELSKGDFVVGHNLDGFDIPFINFELERVKLQPLSVKTIDTMLQGRCATAYGKVPRLQELCWAFDVPYDTTLAHKAAYDVKVMMDAFFKGLDQGWFKLEA